MTFVISASAAEPVAFKLSAVLSNQEFCKGQPTGISYDQVPPEAILLRFRTALIYRNLGVRSAILPVSRNMSIIVSRNIEDLKRERRQLVIPPRFLLQPDDLFQRGVALEIPQLPYFAIVGHELGNQWHSTGAASVPIYNPHDRKGPADLRGKRLLLQIGVDHRTIPQTLARDLRTRWIEFGDLWLGELRSDPVEIEIPRFPEAHVCQSLVRLD